MTTDEVLKALGRYTVESCESEASDGNKTRLGPKVVKLVQGELNDMKESLFGSAKDL
jgi:hypothetical protein